MNQSPNSREDYLQRRLRANFSTELKSIVLVVKTTSDKGSREKSERSKVST